MSVGADMRARGNWIAGAAFNFSAYEAGDSSGSHRLEETGGTLYAGWGHGPWYAGASALFGSLDYSGVSRTITASPVSLGGSYSLTAPRPDDNWALIHVGAAMNLGAPSATFGQVTGLIVGTATAGKDDGDSYAVTVGIRVPL